MFYKGITLEIVMNKGMLSGLWSLKWVLLCLLLTGCPKSDPPTPTPTPSPEITVTGKIMLGPVLGGHSLQIVDKRANIEKPNWIDSLLGDFDRQP